MVISVLMMCAGSLMIAVLPTYQTGDDFVAAVLRPDYPLVVVTHDEADSQVRNPFEQALIEPILRTLADPAKHGL